MVRQTAAAAVLDADADVFALGLLEEVLELRDGGWCEGDGGFAGAEFGFSFWWR